MVRSGGNEREEPIMVMGGNGGDATAWGGGFAARASRRETDEGPAAGSVGGGTSG